MEESTSKAVFLTAEHFIFAKIVTAHRRFSDVLNDPMASYITILEVELVRRHEAGKIVATFPEMLLPKEHVLVAIIREEPFYSTPRHLLRRKIQEQVHVCIPPYEIEGVAYLEKRGQLDTLLSVEGREFIPLTEASIVLTSNPDIQLRADVIVVKRGAICSLSRIESGLGVHSKAASARVASTDGLPPRHQRASPAGGKQEDE